MMLRKRVTIFLTLLGLVVVDAATAQSLRISKSPSFITQDTHFTFDDIMYLRVDAPHIDFTALKKNKWELKPTSDGEEFELQGSFENHLNGSYTAEINLASLNRSFTVWRLEVDLEDDFRKRFKRKIDVTITADSTIVGDLIISGVLQVITESNIQVAGQVILVDRQTRVLENNQPLDYGTLEVGWEVRVIAVKQGNGTLLARTIEVVRRSQVSEKIEKEGRISALTDTSLFISNAEFLVTSATEIKDRDGNRVGFSYLRVGMKVKVEARVTSPGRNVATEIDVLDESTDNKVIDLFGKLEKINSDGSVPDTLEISNQSFEVTSQSRFYGFQQEIITLADLHLGESLQITARTRSNGIPQIEKAYRYLDEDTDLDVQGEIDVMIDSTFVVKGLQIYYTYRTIFLDAALNFISPSILRAGQVVRVLANLAENGNYRAETVIIRDTVVEEFTISEVIEAIGSTWMRIAGKVFTFTEETRFYDQLGEPVTSSYFRVGDFVEVRARSEGGDVFVALQVWFRGLRHNEITIRGVFRAFEDKTLLIDGFALQLDDATRYFRADGSPASDKGIFSAGAIVDVLAEKHRDTWIARSITLQDVLDEEMVFRSRIEGIGVNWIEVLGKRIQVSTYSDFRDEAGNLLQFTDFRVSDAVTVRARILTNGGFFAWRLQKRNALGGQFELEGPLRAFDGHRLELDEFSLVVDQSTLYVDANNLPIDPGLLKQGLVVLASGTQIGSTLLVTRVQLQSLAKITGPIVDRQSDRITLADQTYSLAEDVLVLDFHGRPTIIDSVVENHQAQALIELSGTERRINRLRILKESVTAVESSQTPTAVPSSFQVLPGYPNPINRQQLLQLNSRFRFVLQREAPVTVRIFDLLGREIRTILQPSRLPAGEHEVRWDGLDTQGRLVPAGVYFVRITANKASRVTRILVLPEHRR